MEPGAFEDRIQRRLEEELVGPEHTRLLPPTITVDEVRVEGRYPDAEILVFFRDRRWPECRFGFRWHFAEEQAALADAALPGDSEYFIPMLTWAYLTGLIEAGGTGYPGDCRAGEISWFSGD